ncbi:MAG: glycoside hydrolase family 38 C-terminal domain-containing protein [Promethearchaeota archaeon]
MKNTTKAFVISHTHWDREWYLPFRLFQNKLVILMDYLLDILKNEPSFKKFVADCQVAMIDDYLAVKPAAADAVKDAIASGKLLVGPYYVPPNEWLINGEAYVRNLLYATRILNGLGLAGPNCTAGYSPDSACSAFGHPLQVPQMWRLFQLPLFVGRGLGPFPGGGGFPSDFWWQSPDGSKVHFISLVAGYSSIADLSEDIDKGVATVLDVAKEVRGRYLTPNILLFNGNDHLLPQRHVGHVLAKANGIQDDFEFCQASYEKYASAVESALATAGKEMVTYKGEFMEGNFQKRHDKLRKVNGYFSTRVYLKHANARCEQVLCGHAEPLSALAWIVGGHDYPADHLWDAWKWVIRNHHHDSIPGTSTDTVHQECLLRYTIAEQSGTGIAVKKLNEIAQHVRSIPLGLVEDNDNEDACIIAFNPHPWPYHGPITFNLMDNWLYCAEPSIRLVPLCYAMTMVPPPAFFITDLSNREFAVVKEPIPNDTGYKFNQGVTNYHLSFVSTLPPLGYKVFYLHPDDDEHDSTDTDLQINTKNNTMENQFLRVVVHDDGRITITNKINSREYPDLLEILDYGDRGDEYDQAPVKDPDHASGWSIVSSRDFPPEITWVETASPRGRVDIKYIMKLPRRLAEENKTDHSIHDDFPVTVSLRLFEQTRWLEIVVTMDNRSKNHRIELRVPTSIKTNYIQVDEPFITSTRPAHYHQTAALHRFIDVNDGTAGIAILSRGNYEYNLAAAKNETLIVDLTLLRCVGVLAGHHIGNRWPANSTPDAQCPGITTCELAITCHDGDAISGNIHQIARQYCCPPRAIEPLEHLYLRGKCQKILPETEHSFFHLRPDQLVFTSLYKDEHGDIIYLRFYNADVEPCTAELSLNLPRKVNAVRLVDLRGEPLHDQQSLKLSNNTITVTVRPAQIVTLALTLSGLSKTKM